MFAPSPSSKSTRKKLGSLLSPDERVQPENATDSAPASISPVNADTSSSCASTTSPLGSAPAVMLCVPPWKTALVTYQPVPLSSIHDGGGSPLASASPLASS